MALHENERLSTFEKHANRLQEHGRDPISRVPRGRHRSASVLGRDPALELAHVAFMELRRLGKVRGTIAEVEDRRFRR